VGFESARITGRGQDLAMLRMIRSLKAPATVEVPISTVLLEAMVQGLKGLPTTLYLLLKGLNSGG
jgi:hypothetical protein